MAKITFQDALPRRSLYEGTDAKRLKGFTRTEPVHVPPPVAAPIVTAPYGEWIARIGLTAVDAATLLGVTRQSTYAWSKPEGEVPLHVRQRLALIDYVGLETARIIFSGVEAE